MPLCFYTSLNRSHREAGQFARAALHHDRLEARLAQRRNARGGQRHAALIFKSLTRHACVGRCSVSEQVGKLARTMATALKSSIQASRRHVAGDPVYPKVKAPAAWHPMLPTPRSLHSVKIGTHQRSAGCKARPQQRRRQRRRPDQALGAGELRGWPQLRSMHSACRREQPGSWLPLLPRAGRAPLSCAQGRAEPSAGLRSGPALWACRMCGPGRRWPS